MADESAVQPSAPAVQTTVVENKGGPVVPGVSNAPNNQGVPAPVVPEPETPAPDTKAPGASDVKDLLGDDTPAPTPVLTQDPDSLETGNPIIDSGISILQKVAGLTNDDVMRAMGNAVKFGNPELIDSAFLKERFKEHAEYAEKLCRAYYDDRQQQAQGLVKTAYDAAGGEAQWNVARDVFKAKAPAHQKAAARALIDAGNVQEGVALIMDYCQREGLVVQQGTRVQGAPGFAGAALSSSEFSVEYSKLRKEAGNQSLQSPKFSQRYQDLLARRAAGKSLGR